MKARLERIATRIARFPPVATLMGVADVYGRAAGGLLANGLAYSALFAALPTLLLVLALLGVFLDDPRYQSRVVGTLSDILPPLEPLLDQVLVTVSQGAGISSALGLIGLIWAVSQFYVTVDTAFARLFFDEPERDPVRRTLRGLGWVGLLVGLVVALVVVVSTSSLLVSLLPDEFAAAGGLGGILTAPPVVIAMSIAIVGLAYRVLPPRAPSWRAIAVPAIAAGLAVVVLTQVFATVTTGLVGAAALAGSLASAFVALAWLSFSFQAILICAAWVAIRAGRAPSKAELPGKAADLVEPRAPSPEEGPRPGG